MSTTRTHFTFRVDTWTPEGESIVSSAKELLFYLEFAASCFHKVRPTAAKAWLDENPLNYRWR